jgi:hypothetical protein
VSPRGVLIVRLLVNQNFVERQRAHRETSHWKLGNMLISGSGFDANNLMKIIS